MRVAVYRPQCPGQLPKRLCRQTAHLNNLGKQPGRECRRLSSDFNSADCRMWGTRCANHRMKDLRVALYYILSFRYQVTWIAHRCINSCKTEERSPTRKRKKKKRALHLSCSSHPFPERCCYLPRRTSGNILSSMEDELHLGEGHVRQKGGMCRSFHNLRHDVGVGELFSTMPPSSPSSPPQACSNPPSKNRTHTCTHRAHMNPQSGAALSTRNWDSCIFLSLRAASGGRKSWKNHLATARGLAAFLKFQRCPLLSLSVLFLLTMVAPSRPLRAGKTKVDLC